MNTRFIFKNSKVYDVLKFIAQIALPALGTLYFALASIWHLPLGTEIVGTISAVDTFLGVLLGISTLQYNAYQKELNSGEVEIEVELEDSDEEETK